MDCKYETPRILQSKITCWKPVLNTFIAEIAAENEQLSKLKPLKSKPENCIKMTRLILPFQKAPQ
jgi:hypothetical protein